MAKLARGKILGEHPSLPGSLNIILKVLTGGLVKAFKDIKYIGDQICSHVRV